MAGGRIYYYVIDKLNRSNAPFLEQALKTVPEIQEAKVRPVQGVVEVTASRDVEEQVRIACSVTGTVFRTRAQKKDLAP
jgi:hypothetical protein